MDILKSTTNMFHNLFSKINELFSDPPQEKTHAMQSETKSNAFKHAITQDSSTNIDSTQLKNENLFLNEIIQNAEEGFMILDENHKIKFINTCLLKKNGIPGAPKDFLNRTSLELLRYPFLYENIKNLNNQHKASATILINCETTQTQFEVLIKFFDLNGDNYILTKWHDITLCSKTERVGKDLVANVAHQLRTPLTSIKGYAETLLDGAFDDPQVSKKFLETILRNADRLTNLVKDILTLAKLDETKNVVNHQLINTTTLIKHVVEQLVNFAEDKNVIINFKNPDNDILILGNQQDIEIAIHNLLDNAIKYTANNTTIEIKIDKKDDSAIISIQDHGKGIPQKDCEKIFERFYRIEEGKSKKMVGTGLGLAIVRQIVELHNGRTWVESLWGNGATFYISMPVAKLEDPALFNATSSVKNNNSLNIH